MKSTEIENQVRDIYKLDKRLDQVWRQIQRELPQETVTILENYDTDMTNEGLQKATRVKQLRLLLSISNRLGKNWSDVIKADVDRLVKEIVSKYADINGEETWNSHDFKKILIIFFRWYKLGSRHKGENQDPPEIKGIRLRKPKDKIARENLLDENDRTKLLHACGENQRDRAIIDVFYEVGPRVGELLSVQIKHVKFDDFGAKIQVDGKTGARPIRLVSSTPNLATWFKVHPFGDNPNAPLFILVDKKNYGKPMTYPAARSLIARRAEKANLSKRVYPHLFRHSAATSTAKFMNEAELRKHFGWSNASNMPSKYTHLIYSDVEEKILKRYGMIQSDDVQSQIPKVCPICKLSNSSESTRCSDCGKPLDLKTAIELDKKQEDIITGLQKQMELLNHKVDLFGKTQPSQQILSAFIPN